MDFDFGKLNRPSTTKKLIHPVDIFNSCPSLPDKPNDLWRGQSKALEEWHENRIKNDVLVSLHTGAGKSLVGGLIAQSLVHEGSKKVVYACATNDLVLQTSKDISKMLGLKHTTRTSGSYNNNYFQTGNGFCITNYQALFNNFTVFRGDDTPDAIIFDDAHVAEKIVRDCYSLIIRKKYQSELFNKILQLISPHFKTMGKAALFENLLTGNTTVKVIAVPPNAMVAICKNGSLNDLFQEFNLMNSGLKFSYGHLSDYLARCSMYISKNSIEISPTFLPSKRIPFLEDKIIKRVYLSATLSSEVDFIRAFGRRPSIKISPTSDAGVGERLILCVDKDSLEKINGVPVKDSTLAEILSKDSKLLISTANYTSAGKYKNITEPPSRENFSEELDKFRSITNSGACFILVARVDGIDLPKDTCRLTLADSLPFGFSLGEQYQFDTINMRASLAAKLATRITQLFGRTNRGRNDYSIIFISDPKFKNWLGTDYNLSLLPELLQKQVLLGETVTEQFGLNDARKFPNLVSQVISRDENWLKFYGDYIHGQSVDEDAKDDAVEDDKVLTEAALAETVFAAHMWDGDFAGARTALGNVVDKVVVTDRKLGGWYNIQIGHTYELETDSEAASKQYREAKSRVSQLLALPSVTSSKSVISELQAKNAFHQSLINIYENDVRTGNPKLHKYKIAIRVLFDCESSANQHEEALRTLGELMGFEATRPEKENDQSTTLDVLWRCHDTKQAILFPLKSKKKKKSPLNLEEVGKAFDHQQWFLESYPDYNPLGTIFVAENQSVTKNANPSAQMWITTPSIIKNAFDELLGILLAIESKTPIEKRAEIDALSERVEWSMTGWYKQIKGQNANSAKAV